jgi:PAS domain S-box-containing protein
LIKPSESIADLETRNRSRLLAVFQLLAGPAMLGMLLYAGSSVAFSTYLLVGTLTIAGAYFLNRRGSYTMAVVLTIIIISLNPFVTIVTGVYAEYGMLDEALMWIAATIIAASLLLSLREIVFIIVINVVLTLLVALFANDFGMQDGMFGLIFVMIMAGIHLFSAFGRAHDFALLKGKTAEIAQNEARYRSLFEATFEGIIVHVDGILLDANPTAEKIFGWPLAEAKGRNVFDFVVPEDREAAQQKYMTEEGAPLIARCMRRDGSLIWVEVRGKLFNYEGAQTKLLAVRDITELKQAESHRIELTVEREKVKILRQFIDNASHDFRTPLSTIKTSLYLVERTGDDPKRQHQHLQVVNAQADHLGRLIDDLLSMSRLDRADTSEYRFNWIDLNSLVDSVIETLRPMAEGKKQSLRFEAGADLPQILVDSKEFSRMLSHLLRNAIAYTPEEGVVLLKTRADDHYVILETRDTGIGIGAIDLPHIFERFYRADSARSTETGGNGLGLSIAHRIVEAHGGRIEVESEVGMGSVFRVLMPFVGSNQTTASGTRPIAQQVHD